MLVMLLGLYYVMLLLALKVACIVHKFVVSQQSKWLLSMCVAFLYEFPQFLSLF